MIRKLLFIILVINFKITLSLDRQSTQHCGDDNDTDILKTARLTHEERKKLFESPSEKYDCKKRYEDYKLLLLICCGCSKFLLKELFKKICCCRRN